MRLDLTNLSASHVTARPSAKAAVSGVTLAVAAGEQVAVIGPSGAGKTTLLNALACALRPTSGTLAIDGQTPWTLPARALRALRGTLFLAPQVPPLPPRQRVVTAVLAARLPHQSLWASVRSLFYPDDIALAERALAHFGLADKLFERVDRLSGGERQRVALAQCALQGAPLLLLDEPVAFQDPAHQALVARWLSTWLPADQALVISAHDVNWIARTATHVLALLPEGACAFGAATALLDAPLLEKVYGCRWRKAGEIWIAD